MSVCSSSVSMFGFGVWSGVIVFLFKVLNCLGPGRISNPSVQNFGVVPIHNIFAVFQILYPDPLAEPQYSLPFPEPVLPHPVQTITEVCCGSARGIT